VTALVKDLKIWVDVNTGGIIYTSFKVTVRLVYNGEGPFKQASLLAHMKLRKNVSAQMYN
jgi:hypothetical protein